VTTLSVLLICTPPRSDVVWESKVLFQVADRPVLGSLTVVECLVLM